MCPNFLSRSWLNPGIRARLALLNVVLLATQPAQGADLRAFASQAVGANIAAPANEFSDGSHKVTQIPDGTLPLEAPIDPESYMCGPGDEFNLNFWGRQNASVQFAVDPSGLAFVPKVGYVQIAGLSLKDATAALHKAVAHFYPRLSFEFSLVKPRTFLVHVVGPVERPGMYPAHATDRLTRVLDEAGGVRHADARRDSGAGSLRRIEIQRRNGTKLSADLLFYDLYGETKNNPFLSDGDVIVVPFESTVVLVTGAVQRPGKYELIATKDINEAVKAAGGIRGDQTRNLPVLVSRSDPANDRLTQFQVPFPRSGELPALTLYNNDTVHLPAKSELERSVALVGAIKGATQADEATGIMRLRYEQGDTVRTLIERAGGLGPGADYRGSYLVRMTGSEKVVVPLDLEALLIYRDMRADRPVLIGDVINVPYQRHSIMIEGAVVRPGVYQFNPSLRGTDYIAIAGGPSKMAQDTESYRLVTPRGKTEVLSGKTVVQPGDTLLVPERTFSRAEVTQIVIASVTLIVLAASVGIAAYTASKN